MSKKPNLAGLLADTAGSTRKKASLAAAGNDDVPAGDSEIKKKPAGQGREGTVPITVHHPKPVRDQLKILAVQQSKSLHSMVAEAFNDLFAKYGKPEIAPATENK
jgi:hypothetical protein